MKTPQQFADAYYAERRAAISSYHLLIESANEWEDMADNYLTDNLHQMAKGRVLALRFAADIIKKMHDLTETETAPRQKPTPHDTPTTA